MFDRHWLLTSTTYGNWLPGEERGFVSGLREGGAARETHHQPGTEYDHDRPGLTAYARRIARGAQVLLTKPQANQLLVQFLETAQYRGWGLRAVAIMRNHVHIVVGVPGDPDPHRVLGDFKAYGSRRLNREWGRPQAETWWTEKGSVRKLPDERALLAAIEYLRRQSNPLVVWIAGES